MENKIKFVNVEKQYQNFKLGEISFSIPKGYVTGLIGRNGAGKTTAIKSMLSLIKISGEILIDDKIISDLEYLQDIGIVMDEPFLGKDWKMDIVNQAMKVGYENWDEDMFFDYLNKFSIKRDMKVSELSRGMKIKLMLSMALSHNANLLILDEPTSGLDPMMRDEFTDIIQNFVEDEEHTVLFSTHITSDLEAIADFIVYMDDGKLVNECSKDEFVDSYRLIKCDVSEIDKIDKNIILGQKNSMVGCEVLVKNADLSGFDVVEVPTIEKIMMLYGRTK